ncbi:cell division protein DedD [Moellerella wisconsensis]|uniref:Cell division protein DedD n=1 Tax=Moellerella wisconsensis TaxID=158849 RepID=A0A9Q8PYR2_9GAMM|nr:cell division protein DedD [Moellerella wisconsensis]UNH29693.1 cell division protein DedD [Moellerella wisconsensis]
MASKFQNRLVGAIVLVAAGVIILPALLDGDKKYNEDQFASIPIVPKPGDEEDIEAIAPISQTGPAAISENTSEAMLSEALTEQVKEGSAIAGQVSGQNIQVAVSSKPESKPEPKPQPKPEPKPQSKPEPKPEPEPKPQPVQETTAKAEVSAPQGHGYVVQLGALTNAAKVEEIIAKLRFSGYSAYTVPSSPVNGKLTRIFVGPDASKQKLQNSLAELKRISSLEGQVKPYKP